MEFDEQPQEFELDFGEVTKTGGGGGGAVNSVNGKTGDVVLDAEDVGALPDDTVIPSTAEDVGALPDTTKYGASIEADGTTLTLKDQDGTELSTATTQDTTYTAGRRITIDENNEISSDGLVTLSYGHSTWSDFIAAYSNNEIVYCRASSGADPGVGTQTRLAFMAYVNNEDNPTEVEFQYLRSVSTKSASSQSDQVFVYKLTNSNGGTWTVVTRPVMVKISAGTNMDSSYSNNTLTLNATDTTYSNFTGTDGQTAGASGLVPAPATTDADKFLKADGTWDTAGGGSSSQFKELTTADYNYPTNNPNSVALWKLDPGIYYKADSVTARTDVNNLLTTNLNTIVVGGPIDSGANTIILAFGSAAVNGIPKEFSEFVTNITTGAKSESDSFVPYRYVRNNLTAGSAGYVLDARQGKELKRLIDELDQRVTALGG